MLRSLLLISLLSLCLADKAHGPVQREEPNSDAITSEDKDFWYSNAQNELNNVLNRQRNTNVARNVILFLGDGMNIATITAARIYKGQQLGMRGEEYQLAWEEFPNTALVKTYAVNKQVPDSASTATAYLCGSKTNYYTIGIDATAQFENCSSVSEDSKLTSVGGWAIEAGKRAGFVTSTRVTHATPAGFYAHSPSRKWECDSDVPDDTKEECPEFKDIARQLVEDWPGRELSVILGDGYALLTGNVTSTPDDFIDPEWDCVRSDGRDLFSQWQENSQQMNKSFAAVRTKSEMMNLNTSSIDSLMGIFSNAHLQYEYQKREKSLDVPTLAEMTKTAIEVLQNSDEGYVLLVEGGLIDWAHHDGNANIALDEASAMEDAVRAALQIVDTEETLVLVTADHGHTVTISGYPQRGNDIRGQAMTVDDDLPISTLSYASGPGYYNSYQVDNDMTVVRRNLTEDDYTSFSYVNPSSAPRDSATHSGEDIAVYAIGPMSHLFEGVFEQNYIAHVIGYSACIGQNLQHCA